MFLRAISFVVRLLSAFTRISPPLAGMKARRLSGAAALVSLLAGMSLAAQVSSSHNFGEVEVGNTSAPYTFTFTIPANNTRLGQIIVTTQGVQHRDFGDTGGGTCQTLVTYNKGDTCTVSVSFTPTVSGLRLGCVFLVDGSKRSVGLADFLWGNGVASQATFFVTTGPPSPRVANSTPSGGAPFPAGATANGYRQAVPNAISASLGSGFSYPWGVAVDGGGNVFVADNGNSAVKEIVAEGGYTTVNTLGSGFYGPQGVAVDGGGNVIVADSGNNAVKEIMADGGYTTVNTLGSGFNNPGGVAVDGSGNVFVADTYNNAVKEILASSGYTTVNTLGSGFSYPNAVAVDGSGNVFVTDGAFNYAVKEILAAGGYTTVNTLYSGGYPAGVAVDASGNVYFSDSQYNFVGVIVAPGGYATVNTLLFTSFSGPEGLALDGSGNVFVADTNHNAVVKLDYADPPSLSFNTTSVGSISSDSPQYVTVTNDGNAPLVFTNLSYPADFPEAIGDSNACTSSTSLSPGESCDLPINFSPKAGGSLSEDLVLTDNALNVNGATQSIRLSGSAPQELSLTWATPAAITYGTALSATQLDATASVAGTLVYTPAAGTVLNAGSQTLSVTFTPTDTTDYSPATKSVTLTVNKATPAITWSAPASITYGTALNRTQLDATASVAGTFVYTPAAGTVLSAGKYQLSVTFTPSDTNDYTSATAPVTVTVLAQVAPPIFNLTATPLGFIQNPTIAIGPQTVTISDGAPGATIYYTNDGTAPTPNSVKYTGPFKVSTSETVSAIAIVPGYSRSMVARISYDLITSPPMFTPPGGTYTAPLKVTISSLSPDAMIYYTTDGTIPTASSMKYSAPITVSSSQTISAIAIAKGCARSAVVTASYSLVGGSHGAAARQ